MIPPRVIPILSIDERRLVKTVRYKRPNYIGDPINAIKIFNEKEVDELAILDIRATLKKREPDYDHLFEMAGEAFMPIAYGGGINSFNQAKRVFDCGIEKVIINSAYYLNPHLVREISETYGSQSVVLSLDISKNIFGKSILVSHSGTKRVRQSLTSVLTHLKDSQVGEIVINDITKEGRYKGYNLRLIEEVANSISLPTIANCGAASIKDFEQALKIGASAVAASSMFVYRNQNTNSILINYPNEHERSKITS